MHVLMQRQREIIQTCRIDLRTIWISDTACDQFFDFSGNNISFAESWEYMRSFEKIALIRKNSSFIGMSIKLNIFVFSRMEEFGMTHPTMVLSQIFRHILLVNEIIVVQWGAKKIAVNQKIFPWRRLFDFQRKFFSNISKRLSVVDHTHHN